RVLVVLDELPPRLGVAAGAVRAQRALVRIVVAALARREVDRLHLHERRRVRLGKRCRHVLFVDVTRVALRARDFAVLAQQVKRRVLVIEAGRRLPRRLVVALLAFVRQLAAVLVEVARIGTSGWRSPRAAAWSSTRW